jgi:zinc protease
MRPRTRSLILLAAMFIISTTSFATHGRSAEDIPTVLLPIKDSPLVTFRIQFAVGSVNDPAGKKGLTELTASLLTNGGTAKRDYAEIVDTFYPMATSVSSLVDKEVTTVYGTVHKDHLKKYYDVMMEMLLQPGFREDDFERIKTDRINYLEKELRGNDDEDLGKESLNVFMYENHPYGTPVQGLVSDLKSITLDDVKKHYATFFTRENVIIGLAGDSTADVSKMLRQDLAKLPSGQKHAAALPKPEAINGIEVLAVEKECRSTAVSMGFPIDVRRGDKDFYPLMIANSYLGEHRTFNGVLMNRMRGARGLNYGDYSYIENFIQEGGSTFPVTNIPRTQQFFSIWIRPVLHKNRHFAIRLAIWELDKLIRDGMSEEDFETTRSFLKNYSRLWAQNQSQRLGYLMDSKFYKMDDYIGTLPKRLDAVNLDDVNAAIRKYLSSKNMKVAVVTKGASEFLDDLVANKPSPIVYDAEDMPAALLAEDKKIEVYTLDINKDGSRVISAQDLFE